MLLKKRGELINQFSKNNIISKNEEFYDVPKNMEERTSKKLLFEPIEVSEDMLNSIKLKIFWNKKWSTTTDKKDCTISDKNDLVDKIDKKVSTEMRLLIFTMIF